MASVHTEGSTLTIRSGGGRASLLGLPFLVAGLLLGRQVIGVVSTAEASRVDWATVPITTLAAIALTTLGLVLALGRRWLKVDVAEPVVLKQVGLLFPMRTRRFAIEMPAFVSIGFDTGDSDAMDKFPVTLHRGGEASIPLASPTAYSRARAQALAVAAHLGVDIEDATTDHPTRLHAADADLSLVARRRGTASITMPDRPFTLRSEISEHAEGVRIDIPNRRMHPIVGALLMGMIAVPFLLILPVHRLSQWWTPTSLFGVFAFVAFLVAPAGVAAAIALSSRYGGTIVHASSAGVRLAERLIWRTRPTLTFTVDDVLDVDYGTSTPAAPDAPVQTDPSAHAVGAAEATVFRAESVAVTPAKSAGRGSITIKGRDGLTKIAQGLDDEEVRYLHAIICRALLR